MRTHLSTFPLFRLPRCAIRLLFILYPSSFILSLYCAPAAAIEHFEFRNGKTQLQVDGRIVVTAQDGGVLLQGRDGALWPIDPDEQLKHTHDDTPFKPFSADELGRHVLAQLPAGFEAISTAHYVICYNTSKAYAQWCGSLFERLYMAFTNCWSRKGFTLKEPEFPLVAVVFADKAAYRRFSQAELGPAADAVIGYFSLQTNRMTMYDLTGAEAVTPRSNHANTLTAISQFLSRPDAERTVSTIVHEATHQIAFNCGLHTRLSDCPLWFSEGIATYFETPDLSSAKGWRGIGMVNQSRLANFKSYLPKRPANSLETLLTSDDRLRQPEQAGAAYAEAWALTYFLVRQHPKQYVAYLQLLSDKKPLLFDKPQTRLQQFTQVFGDLKSLDTEFVRYMAKAR
jgi:hypothetical protein